MSQTTKTKIKPYGAQTKNLPHESGCYLFLNKNRHIIYVGKSKNIQQRVQSYFTKSHNFRMRALLEELYAIDYIVTFTEKEALILEHNLIKKHKPKYNILLKDDKMYPYIIVTAERDPTLKYVRVLPQKYTFAYGPLPEGSHAYQLLKILQTLIPLRRCRVNQKQLKQPCTHYLLGQCSGSCFKTISPSYYQKQILKIKQFFDKDKSSLDQILRKRLTVLSESLQFEEAQKLKVILDKLYWINTDQVINLGLKVNLDFVNFIYKYDRLFIVILFFRQGKLLFKEQVHFKCDKPADITYILRICLQNIYSNNVLPDHIILPDTFPWIDLKTVYGDLIATPKTTAYRKILDLSKRNAELFQQHVSAFDVIRQTTSDNLATLQKTLHLKTIPFQIDLFDISNWGMDFYVGACCVFKNGYPVKAEWRKYNLEDSKFNHQKADIHSISETITKRYQSIINHHDQILTWPDLIVVDGGWPQIQAAQKILDNLYKEEPYIKIVGLSKDKHHKTDTLVVNHEIKFKLDRLTTLYRFLENLQNSVHNYAISGFRYKKRQSLKTNILLKVAGISNIKAQLLYQKFHTLGNMKEQSFTALNVVLKNKRTTNNLLDFLKNHSWSETKL